MLVMSPCCAENPVLTPDFTLPSHADELTHSLPAGRVRIVAAKEHVFCEGDPATHVYRVEAGHICIYRMLPDGRRQVINFACPGDFVGLGSLGTHATSAQASTRTRLRSFPMTHLQECAAQDARLGLKLYEAVAEELTAARDLLMTVCHRTASERLAAFLLALSRRNRRRGESELELVLPMTRADIADLLGLTIETISRTFTKFRVEGLIDLEQCILVTIRNSQALELAAGLGTAGSTEVKLAS
jgi:CRP/FNR family transcriptional regulator